MPPPLPADLELEGTTFLCFKVVPPAFFTSGAFSFVRVFRVPRSGYGLVDSAVVDPEGSVKIERRALLVGVGVDKGKVEVDDDAARTVRRVVDEFVEASTGGVTGEETLAEDIIRFWKSR
jgi:hypothetical protein